MSTPKNSKSTENPSPISTPAPTASAAKRPAPKPAATSPLPPYRVLLHNDDMNDMRFVVRTLVELIRLDSTNAMKVMLEAHAHGIALVLVTHKERAELYREQFASRGLTASIEPENAR